MIATESGGSDVPEFASAPSRSPTFAAMVADDILSLAPIDDGRTSLVLTPPLVRFDGQLFGGTGLAAVVESMERVAGRDALWATVQFVGSAAEGERIDLTVEVVAAGGTTTQARITGTVDGRLVIAGLGAAARRREDGFEASFGTIPEVVAPEECPPLRFGSFDLVPGMSDRGPFAIGEYRAAPGEHGAQYVWIRLDGVHFTRSLIAYVADMVPSAVLRAAGRFGGGTSLDNTMRFGPPVPAGCEWILLDTDPYLAHNGFVHGAARVWADDGTLLAVATQSAIARVFGPEGVPISGVEGAKRG